MEKRQGFFSALKGEVVRGLSPARSRGRRQVRSVSPGSGLLRRRRGGGHVPPPEVLVSRSGILRPSEALSPLKEGPDPDEGGARIEGWGHWMKGQLCRAPSTSTSSSSSSASAAAAYQRSDLRLMLSVLGAPLAPVHVSNSDPLPHLSIKDTPIESSSAQYILQQYTAACGGQKLQNSIVNAYAMGKVRVLATAMHDF